MNENKGNETGGIKQGLVDDYEHQRHLGMTEDTSISRLKSGCLQEEAWGKTGIPNLRRHVISGAKK